MLWKERAEAMRKHFRTAWRRGGRVVWVVAATTIVMVLPLLMEIEREGSVIELEKLQIKDLKTQGFTDSQIQQMGLSQTPEPAVGLNKPTPAKI